jgi:hypothetical protein
MLPFVETAHDLAEHADAQCWHCAGAGWFLREDKAPVRCPCTRLDRRIARQQLVHVPLHQPE